MTRKYELKQRAARQEETRQRIIEAAVNLHETLGPAKTTISAIAERAGVQRLTVYRHFPDDEAVYRACTSHWSTEHPAPDPSNWTDVQDPSDRLRLALTELYVYFQRGEQMLSTAYRDLPHVPTLAKLVAEIESPYWEKVHRTLIAGWLSEQQRLAVVAAAIGHATDFATWQSLTQTYGMNLDDAISVMACFVNCAAGAQCPGEIKSG